MPRVPSGSRLTPAVALVSATLVLGLTGCARIEDPSAIWPSTKPDVALPTPIATAAPTPSPTPTPSPIAPVAPVATGDRHALRDLPEAPRVLIIGDSFTEGYGATSVESNWAVIASETLGWRSTIDGIGGTGFAKSLATDGRDELDYRRRVVTHAASGVRYDLVVLQGGLNDWRAEPAVERAAVRATVAAVRAAWPDAAVVVFGPSSPPPSRDVRRNAEAVRLGSADSGAILIDPDGDEPWVNASNAERFDLGDGLHLNDAGYLYLAARFIGEIERLGG